MALAEQLRTGGTATGATGAVGSGALGSGAVGSGAVGSGATGAAGAGAAGTAEVPAVAEVTGAVEVLSAFVAGFEPARFSGPDAERLVGLFTRASRLCEAGKALSAKRATDANRHQASGFKTPSQWLASVTGDSVGDAADTLELASTMERHPGVDHSYRKGKLSKARAKAVGEAVRANPDSEGELLGAAEGTDTLRQVKERCDYAKARARRAEADDARYRALHRSRALRTWVDSTDGAFRLDARLTPDAGARLRSALQAEERAVFEAARKRGETEPSAAYACDALVALVTGQPTPRASDATDGTTDGASDATDGTGAIDATDGTSTTTTTAGRTRTGSPRRDTITLRVDLDALLKGDVGDGQVCEIPGVGPVPLSLATDLLGEAICHLVITDGCDVTTTCGLGRNVPAALQRALRERDPVCVVPGCDQPRGIEIDHRVIDFKDDGPTMLWNLARLCVHHHRLRTHQGFVLERRPAGWLWRTPDGREITNGDSRTTTGADRVPGTAPDPPPGTSDPPPGTSDPAPRLPLTE